jgi:hypothetical protein
MFTNAQREYWAEEIAQLAWDHRDGKVPYVKERAENIVESIVVEARRAFSPPLVPHVTAERMLQEQIVLLSQRIDALEAR